MSQRVRDQMDVPIQFRLRFTEHATRIAEVVLDLDGKLGETTGSMRPSASGFVNLTGWDASAAHLADGALPTQAEHEHPRVKRDNDCELGDTIANRFSADDLAADAGRFEE